MGLLKKDDDDTNCEIVYQQILSWRTEGVYEVFGHMYG